MSILSPNQNDNDVISSDMYNAEEGKLLASLSWLITKVYKANIPDNLINPCYKDDSKHIRLKTGTAESLVSGELYSAAISAIFQDQKFLNKGHAHVIRALNDCSIILYDENGDVINETALNQKAPFHLNAHLAMIDGLMTAYVYNSINVDRVVNCLKKYANIHPNEMPCDDEDALLFWINKICSNVRDNMDKIKQSNGDEVQPLIPEMDDLYEDFYDGICIATVLSFYAADKLHLNDICFNDPSNVDDCLHNLRLIKKFCQEYFAWKVFHFAFEDILYMHESLQQSNGSSSLLQPNVSAFVADLFNLLETFNLSKSQPGASLSKQFINKVNESNDRNKNVEKHSSTFGRSPKPSLANNATLKETVGISSSTSRLNSKVPSMTEKFKSKESPLKLNLSTIADGQTQNSMSLMRKSPTTTFGTLSPNRDTTTNVGVQPSYQRSDSLPVNQIQTSNGTKGPSWSVRMQLEEKRRQIESQKLTEKVEKIRQSRDTNKEAFLTLYGKKPPVQQNKPTLGSPTGAAAKLIRPAPIKAQPQQEQSKSLKDYDDISKSIREIKEQMKRLSVEQEKLQTLVVQPSPVNAEIPTMVPVSKTSSSFQLHATSPQTPVAHARTSTSSPSGPMEAGAFHLHADNEPPSRLDPSLELTKNLTSWGMTYRVSKTPRKTWENQTYAVNNQQNRFENEFNFVFGNNNNMNDRAAFDRTAFHSNGNGAPNVNLEQNQHRNIHSPSGLNAPFMISDAGVASTSIAGGDVVPAEPDFSAPYYTNRELTSPIFVATRSPQGASSTNADEFLPNLKSPPLPMSPLTFGTTMSNDSGSSSKSSTPVPFQIAKESSPAIGFVIGDDERRKEEEFNRLKEQKMERYINRKLEHDKRKAKLEEENARRQEELIRKQEEEEQKKKEKELHRLKVFEQYQKKKAEQEAIEQGGGVMSSSTAPAAVPKLPQRMARGHSQPPGRHARPISQVVIGKTPALTNAGPGSVDNLDLIDGKSQSSDGGSVFGVVVEPSLKPFVKPKQKSNRNIVYNAIQFSVLAGSANTDKKNKVLEELAKSDSKHFLILFRDQKCQYRGLYSWDQVSDTVHKLHGLGPKSCSENFMKLLFKYDSGAKQFSEIPAKHLSATIDGFSIKDEYWQEKKPLYAKSMSMGK